MGQGDISEDLLAREGKAVETLDDGEDREATMAELKARIEAHRQAVQANPGAAALALERARPRERDDELLADPPETSRLGRIAGWEAGRPLRRIVGGGLVLAFVVAIVAYQLRERQARHEELHPLPEVESTIPPGTPREMTISEGAMRLGLGREAPAVEIVHLPDRDIVLAEGHDKAQFKVEVAGGKTTKIVVLTGGIREVLHAGAQPLL